MAFSSSKSEVHSKIAIPGKPWIKAITRDIYDYLKNIQELNPRRVTYYLFCLTNVDVNNQNRNKANHLRNNRACRMALTV